ncbi:type III-A CRISPR-associated protein Cas10/Csm1 [Nitrincola tibetensis]|uniref:CRISPR system single-strand-specific deoxyribonuclease Cas10/Csm1 (subtype III-A) n=1 Tax=Nitrincola tibetensis TaxID=2219697 RepID=A0A364NKU0_9GAMM|nr:type III-A CRISPR-associated protein Cas10/Csm1 [Nitrincola tibetensis]RAU17610.1 type III-A CRISPR-associated protein Cas10/Csm1 [Nitrincola tibetensis]
MSELRLEASSRVALAAFLHDLGKFAERARIPIDAESLEIHKQLYCARKELKSGLFHYTHIHAAYTALAFNEIEKDLPALKGTDFSPFGSSLKPDVVDSLVNAAACHHRPDTFLQWIIATADRVASGFEREAFERYNDSDDITDTGLNHYQTRQLSLFESIRLTASAPLSLGNYQYRLPLKPMSPEGLFPVARKQCEGADNKAAQAEYADLWQDFLQALTQIAPSHRTRLSLWLDHFDSAWQTFTHAIPSATVKATKPDVSLYDHSHTTAALATALWRYHADQNHDLTKARDAMRLRNDWDEHKLLLIQGDFFGVQSFIFANGSDTRKRAAKLLRGRSLYVSLITECAALKILEALDLPSTSQVTNAAGKFLIVAPNTPENLEKLSIIQTEIDEWFLNQSFGQSGLGLAWTSACCNDFVEKQGQSGFSALMKRLFAELETRKYQAFNLCADNPAAPVFTNYLDTIANAGGKVCAITGWGPGSESGDVPLSPLAADQIQIGEMIAGKRERLAITKSRLKGVGSLRLALFGYHLHLTSHEDASGMFGAEVASGNLRRLFDFALPKDGKSALWNGYARRAINGYVPTFNQADVYAEGRYGKHEDKSPPEVGELKEFGHIACEDRKPLDREGEWVGVEGIGILKGDVDDLGAIFQKGLEKPTFAKMAALSRQMNAFFSTWLPWVCRSRYPNTYTVFAGGDDFFLIGPWHSIMQLSRELRQDFARYVANNPEINFSAGVVVAKPGSPVPTLARMGEEALEQAKSYQDKQGQRKNAISCFGQAVSWADFWALADASDQLEKLIERAQLSTGFVYSLLDLTRLAGDKTKPESGMWRSRLNYRAWRHLEKSRDAASRRALCDDIVTVIGANGIQKFDHAYLIALTTQLYLNRD